MRTPGRIELVRAEAGADHDFELLVYGNIGDYWWGESVIAQDVVKQINEAKASTILVRINSRGGIVADGIAIYNALRSSGAEITTRVEGTASSIASLIFMAGDKREMGDNTTLMIHAPWGGVAGNATQLREAADVLDKLAEAMAKSYIRSGQSKKAVLALMQDGKDHWYTADEAKKDGYCTAVINETESDDEIVVAALTRYTAPASVLAMHAAALQRVMAEQRKPATKKPASPAPSQEKFMFKALAKALGLKIADDADAATARAALTAHYKLKSDASDDDVAKAFAQASAQPAAPAKEPDPVDQAQAVVRARDEERTRVAGIIEFCAKHNADAPFQAKAIKDGWSQDRCAAEILNERAAKGDDTGPSGIPAALNPANPPEAPLARSKIFEARRKSAGR